MRNTYFKKYLVIGILILFLAASMVAGVPSPPAEWHGTRGVILYVGGSDPATNYTTIQDAINAASPGDTIFVYDYSSPYVENVLIDRQVNLIGENKYTTIIDGNHNDVVHITADILNISGFTITNGGYGLFLEGVPSSSINILSDCYFSGNDGIYLWDASGNHPWIETISHCQFAPVGYGITMWWYNYIGTITDCYFGGCGIYTNVGAEITNITRCTFYAGHIEVGVNSTVDMISYCVFQENPDYGIKMAGAHLGGPANIGVISHCDFRHNMYGFQAAGHVFPGPMITECDFLSNEYGIHIYYDNSAMDGPIFHNNFIGNTQNAYESEPRATWDDGNITSGSGGNYWDDCTGPDLNGDGIGDYGYFIWPGRGLDRYPFMAPNGWNTPPNKPDTPWGPYVGSTANSYPYSTSVIDPEGDKVKYGWDWDGDNIINPSDWDDNNGLYYYSGDPITTYHQWTNEGVYRVKVIVEDIHGTQSVFSDDFLVIMPRERTVLFHFHLLNWLFEHFPQAFPLLRHLMGY